MVSGFLKNAPFIRTGSLDAVSGGALADTGAARPSYFGLDYNASVDEEKRKYTPVTRRTREALEEIFRTGTPEKIREALWSATYHDPDWRWVQTECLSFLASSDLSVRRSAATCLGLIAVFHNKLDVELVLAALKKAGEDAEVKPWVEESMADIRHSMKVE